MREVKRGMWLGGGLVLCPKALEKHTRTCPALYIQVKLHTSVHQKNMGKIYRKGLCQRLEV